jgi:hypothetical protein
MIDMTRPMKHRQVTHYQGTVERQPSPAFLPPVPTGMIEPGVQFPIIQTVEGPILLQTHV